MLLKKKENLRKLAYRALNLRSENLITPKKIFGVKPTYIEKGVKTVQLADAKGFTLVEVLIALLLLSLVTVGVVQIYNRSVLAIISSGNKTEALHEVQRALERESASSEDQSLSILFKLPEGTVQAIEVDGIKLFEEIEVSMRSNRTVSATLFIPKENDEE